MNDWLKGRVCVFFCFSNNNHYDQTLRRPKYLMHKY